MEKDPALRKAESNWIIGLVLLSLVDLTCQAVSKHDGPESIGSPEGLGYLLGATLGATAVFWAILYFTFGRKLPRYRNTLAFIIFFIVSGIGSFFGIVGSKVASNQKLVSHDMQIYKDWLRELQLQTAVLNNRYSHELDEAGWGMLLSGERLAHDKKLHESMQIVERTKAIVDRYQKLNRQLTDSLANELLKRDLSEGGKKGFMSGYKSGNSVRDSVGMIEKQLVVKAESIIILLEAERGKWHVEQGKLHFDDPAVTSRFRVLNEEIQLLADKEDQIQKRSARQADETTTMLENNTR